METIWSAGHIRHLLVRVQVNCGESTQLAGVRVLRQRGNAILFRGMRGQ